MRLLQFVGLAIAVFTSSLGAQQIDRARTGFAPPAVGELGPIDLLVRERGDTNVGQMLAAGTFAAVVGIVGGAYAGYKIEEPHCGADAFFCGLAGGIIGAAVGSTVLIPSAIHVVSQHSSFAAKLGMSALMLASAAAVAVPTHGVGALLMPPAQIIATMWIENRAARKHNATMGAAHRH